MGFSIFRVGKVWHYRFRVGGKRIQRTTGETDRARAEELAFQVYRRERLVKDGRGPVPTLRELVDAWLTVHGEMLSIAHVRAVRTFGRGHLYDLGEIRIDRVTTERVEQARARHLEGRRPASVNHWLAILRLLFGWAEKHGLISGIPWRVQKQKLQKRPRVTLPAARAQEWLAAVDQASRGRTALATAIRLMLGLGLRESEALSARWEWMDFERRAFTPGRTKGREADAVPVPEWLAAHLEAFRKPEGLIAESPRGGEYVRGTTRGVIAEANEACGTPGLTPHRLRGTFATLLSEAGVPVQVIQKVMRHKDPLTTMRYLESDVSRAAAGVEEIGRRLGFGARQVLGERRPADTDGV
jgi:integrase